MRVETDGKLSLNRTPAEGERCAHCDRVFEIGDLIHTESALVPPDQGQRIQFEHFHEGCWLMARTARVAPVRSENAGFYRELGVRKATA